MKHTYDGVEVGNGVGVRRLAEINDLAPPLLYSRRGERGIGLEDGTITSLPADLSNPTSAQLKEFSRCIRSIRVAERKNEGGDVFGLAIKSCQRMTSVKRSRRRLTLICFNISAGMIVSVMADAAIYS